MLEPGFFCRKCKILTLVGEELVRPDFLGHLNDFPEEGAVFLVLPGVGVRVELGSFVGPNAPTKPHIHPAPGQVVQDGNVFGEAYRVPPGSYIGHLANANLRRPCSEVGAQQDRVGDVSGLVGAEVMFAQPHRLESHLLCKDGLLPEVIQQVRCGSGIASGVGYGSKCCKPHIPDSLLYYPAGMDASFTSLRTGWGGPTVTLGTRLLMLQSTS